MSKSKPPLSPKLKVQKPVSALFKPVKADFKDLFKALAKGVGHTATGKWIELAAQSQKQPPPGQQREDVVRVNTNLVQTDVMVFDKQGHFVDGLQRDQFELLVDGKPQAISFFEQVRAGSVKEQSLKLNTATIPSEKPTTVNENRGRIIVFFWTTCIFL